MKPNTDTKLNLYDASGGLAGPFVLTEIDLYDATPLRWAYITPGSAADLPIYFDSEAVRLPAPNIWTYSQMRAALDPVPEGERVVVNYEGWNKHGRTPRDTRIAMARLNQVRPDIEFAPYNMLHTMHEEHWLAIHNSDIGFYCATVFPGRNAKRQLSNIKDYMEARPCRYKLIVATGWEQEPSTEGIREIVVELKSMGISDIAVWDNPPKPGVKGRSTQHIFETADIIMDVYGAGVPSSDKPDADADAEVE